MGSLNCDFCDLGISRIERGRESEFPPTRIAISGQRSARVGNRSSVLQKMALGVGNRSSLLQKIFCEIGIFLMGYAFFWQETASFCNFKLTMGVI